MMKKSIAYLVVFMVSITYSFAQKPFFKEGQDPKPTEKKWVAVSSLSDEFKKKFDKKKWLTSPETYPGWKGRIPGKFSAEAISVKNGNLRILASELEDSIKVYDRKLEKTRYWTHQGALVRSKETAQPGWYFECRMKANKTFMSSTFWLINDSKKAGEGCEKRITELDIQECVGKVINPQKWSANFHASMHSNTHDRRPANLNCSPNRANGDNAPTDGFVYEDYHVYGAWWKSSTEVLFFLDGEHMYTVTPPSEYNLPMHLMMVVETYDWNPPKKGFDGMDYQEADRTTYYDWVRTWKLK